MIKRLGLSLASRRLFLHNLIALYGLYLAGYVLSLVTVPYLGRVLGPHGWGLLSFVQAFTSYLLLFVEFGFGLSATREIARVKERSEQVAGVLSSVLAVRFLLIGGVLLTGAAGAALVPAFRQHPVLFWSGMFWGIMQGSNLLWFFQGLEQARRIVVIDLSLKTAAVVLIFALVKSPADAWLVFTLQGAASSLSLAFGLMIAYRTLPFVAPCRKLVWSTFRDAAAMFVLRNAWMMYAAGNTFLLGLFVPPAIVGYYSAADRLSRAALGLLGPASEALYPRMIGIARQSKQRAGRMARWGVLALCTVGAIMAAFLYFLAPFLIRVAVGPGFEPAIPVLRVLSLILPLIAVTNALGMNLLLPFGKDKLFATIVIGA